MRWGNQMLNGRRSDYVAYAALVSSCTIWGTSFAFGKLALRNLTVSQLVLLRFGLASLVICPIIVIKRAWLHPREVPRLLLTGILAVPVSFLLQFNGLSMTTVMRASLIIGSIPPLLALGGVLFLGEQPGRRGWAIAIASVLGVLVITGSPGESDNNLGDLLVFFSALVTVVWVLINKRLSEEYGASIATAYLLLFGTLTLTPFTLLRDGLPRTPLPLATWLSVFALGVVCTAIAFVLWNWGLERIPASTAGIYLNLEPLVGALLGVLFWQEALSGGVILGGILVVGAAILATQPT